MTSIISSLPIAMAMLDQNMAHGGWDVRIMATKHPGATEFVEPIVNPVIRSVPTGTWHEPEPAFTLCRESAQHLFDAMWAAGIRPTSAKSSDDSATSAKLVAALENNLADLRRVAFGVETRIGPADPDKPFTLPDGCL